MSEDDRRGNVDRTLPGDGRGGAARLTAGEQLLFGVIALQNDFIARDQFIAAFDAWVQDKSRSVASILEDRGALASDQRQVLEMLLALFLKRNDGDVEESLAVLSTVSMVRRDLEELNDPDLHASLEHVGTRIQTDPQLVTTLPYVGLSDLGRFRILRPHAKGGLGTVSIALDQDLNREVALKEIQPQHADRDVYRERFIREAEITGGLEHPGIVPIYAFGKAPDGRPFYVMRFIKGNSLKEAVDAFHRPDNRSLKDPAKQLELRQLLGRFIDVCNAVEYAHSRGVLHRDLKPGNIMVGKYGETLVVDWGLAKAAGRKDVPTDESTLLPSSALSSSGQTQPGSAIGTPAYMSPEQALGRLDELSPATDVYGLGATLYHVLTGQPPFKGAANEVVEKLTRGEFAAPRSHNPELSRGLEAICLKAMSIKPADRYASARALADDLERWLADESLSAMPDRLRDRWRRFSRRRRGYAMFAAMTTLFLVFIALEIPAMVFNLRSSKDFQREREAYKERTRQAEATAASLTFNDFQLQQQTANAIQFERLAADLEAKNREQNGLVEELKAKVEDLQQQLESQRGE